MFGGEGSDAILNLYARRGAGRPNLCFAGHTDVVPPGAREAWSFDPFGAGLRDGALWGRGAVDMKGAIAAFIAAAERWLADEGPGFDGSISLLITGDEEGAGLNGTRKVLDWLAARGEMLDACVVGEPTSAAALGDMVKIGRRGSLTGRLTVHGVQGHTAYPHLADNAAHRLVAMLHALTTAELDRGLRAFPALDPAGFDDRHRQPGGQRDPGRGARRLQHPLQRSLDQRQPESAGSPSGSTRSGGRYDARHHGQRRIVSRAARAGSATALAEAIRRVTGRTPELSTTGGTSDARFIHAYCPVAEFGLVGQTMHKADERVDLADLAALTEIYRTFLDLFFGIH